MYKVFFNDRKIYLDDNLPDMTRVGKDYVCAFENVTDLKPQLKQFLVPGKSGNLYIFHDDQDALFRTFSQCFTNINAGGGLVRNREGEILVIFRRGKWDLPKGKAEEGETIEQAALREVTEECGLQEIEPGGFLTTTFHIYIEDGNYMLKKTDWYSMSYSGTKQPRPLESEDITRVRWIGRADLEEIYSNIFPSIIDVIESAL
jgi:8-oxo-dGTP pyrophosphatase MutT (NUDIX family)